MDGVADLALMQREGRFAEFGRQACFIRLVKRNNLMPCRFRSGDDVAGNLGGGGYGFRFILILEDDLQNIAFFWLGELIALAVIFFLDLIIVDRNILCDGVG